MPFPFLIILYLLLLTNCTESSIHRVVEENTSSETQILQFSSSSQLIRMSSENEYSSILPSSSASLESTNESIALDTVIETDTIIIRQDTFLIDSQITVYETEPERTQKEILKHFSVLSVDSNFVIEVSSQDTSIIIDTVFNKNYTRPKVVSMQTVIHQTSYYDHYYIYHIRLIENNVYSPINDTIIERNADTTSIILQDTTEYFAELDSLQDKNCSDNIDGDLDGLVDCEDPLCINDVHCIQNE